MSRQANRLFAALLSLVILAGLTPLAARGTGGEYIYQYPEEDNKPYYQMSMYAYNLVIGSQEHYITGIFRLLNTEEDNAVSYAYCANSDIYDEYGFFYKAMPLGECSATQGAENQLRAIVNHAYPFISQEEMIRQMESDGVTLHTAQVPCYEMVLISAVQQAIYGYTNPGTTIVQPFAGPVKRADYEQYRPYIDQFNDSYLDREVQVVQDEINADVNAVIGWLMDLPGETAPQPAAQTFQAEIEAELNGYLLTLSGFSEGLRQADALKVTVAVNGQNVVDSQPITLDSQGKSQILLPGTGLSEASATITVKGTETYTDAAAYEARAEAGGKTSQPFIGRQALEREISGQAAVSVPAAVEITPADLTIYMGGEDGYDAVVDGADQITATNALPRPLFYVNAPTGVDPAALTFSSTDPVPGTEGTCKQWTAEAAGEDRVGQTLYYLNKVHEGQDEVRVQYTVGENAFVNDQFDPSAVENLFEDYTISLYTGAVDPASITAAAGGPAVYPVTAGTGTLRVRAVENGEQTPETNPVYHVQPQAPSAPLEAGTAAVTAPEGTAYTLNHTTVPVPAAGVGLLFDDIYDKDNGQNTREDALISRTDTALGTVADGWTRFYQAKYLDLVDTDNGNAWVKTAGQAVTVFWAYPEGTDSSTSFQLLHFENLHRDDADDASSGYTVEEILAVSPTEVEIEKTAAGIAFSVPSGGFSPFVLVWELPNGDLVVTKTVQGSEGDAGKSWNFTVTLGDTGISGTYGDMTFTAGVASFTLKSGQSKRAVSLPAGTAYTVAEAEADQDGYSTAASGSAGTIPAGGAATAAFTNTKGSGGGGGGGSSDPVGSLRITKTVTGEAETDEAFTFTVTLTTSGGSQLGSRFSYSGSSRGTLRSGESITLRHGESVTISGIPAGSKYTVTEAAADGYTTTATGDAGTITSGRTAVAAFVNAADSASVPPEDPDDPDGPDAPGDPEDSQSPAEPDTAGDPEPPDDTGAPSDPNTPQTGDAGMTGLWALLCSVSLAGVLAAFGARRRRRDRTAK